MELIYKGSVKDLYKNKENIVFKFSDRYSIFDWGEMPNEIPHKGEALASMALSFFDHLESKGVATHYLRALDETSFEVQSVKVLRPTWIQGHYDYSVFQRRPTNSLVPLEVIFRKRLGQGNSLESRILKNPDYIQELGLQSVPNAESTFEPVLVEFSTKLEATDRYLSKREIAEMNIFQGTEIQSLTLLTQKVASEIDSLFSKLGIQLWDGKFEFAFGVSESSLDRSFMLVDSIGPDELRLTFEGLPLSKEFLRQIYRSSSWNQAVIKAKELAKERKIEDWKTICRDELKENPLPLAKEAVEVCSLMYMALANAIAKGCSRHLPFDKECTILRWHREAQKVLGRIS